MRVYDQPGIIQYFWESEHVILRNFNQPNSNRRLFNCSQDTRGSFDKTQGWLLENITFCLTKTSLKISKKIELKKFAVPKNAKENLQTRKTVSVTE